MIQDHDLVELLTIQDEKENINRKHNKKHIKK